MVECSFDSVMNFDEVMLSHFTRITNRVPPRFFDQVGHQTTNASIGNKYIFTKIRTELTKIGHIFSK